MTVATVTSKGQITIPQDVRERLGIVAGTKVEFVPTPQGRILFIPRTGLLKDLAGIVKWDGPPVTVEEMDEAITEGAVERYQRSFA
jgi:AbrB family looped-hinge helix DNA binding protein